MPDDAVRVELSATADGVAAESRLPHLCAPYIAQPPILPDNPEIQSHLHRYLYGHSDALETHHANALSAYLEREPIQISVFLLMDIYIGKRARLVIDGKTQVLFARYITIETSGLLDVRAPFGADRLHAASAGCRPSPSGAPRPP